MDLPTALLRDLLHLASSIDLDHEHDGVREPTGASGSLHASLLALSRDLSAAVPTCRGLHLLLVQNGYPVNLTAFGPLSAGETIATSLRLPLPAVGTGLDAESRIVFYATAGGAFVDLAADLGYALTTPTISAGTRPRPADPPGDGQQNQHREPHRPILLDADLPPITQGSGLTGLDQLSTINRAVGILIEQGHQPDRAHTALRRYAAAAGLEPHSYAALLLRR